MKNKEIAEVFNRLGFLFEMKADNVFKIRAYFKAAESIENLAEDIEVLIKENRLSEIPGIGQALREKIVEYCQTGKISAYEELIKEIPESIFEIMEVPSVGPKKAKLFFDQLKIKNLEDLRQAAETGKLLDLEGIKEKTVENILQGIKILQAGRERMNLGTATRLAEEIVGALQEIKEVKRIEVAGSLRRQKETVRDIDILIDSTNPQKVMEIFIQLPCVKKVNVRGDTKSSILTDNDTQVDLRVVEPTSFGAALLYFTGSKNFNVRLRQIALKKGMKVNEYGIFKVEGDQETLLASKTEEDCLRVLGLPFIPPELREDIGEDRIFSTPQEGIPPLIELKDIKGDLHVHSTWSDGRNTIKEMAEAARRLGYQYLGVSDHSERLKVAKGVSPGDLKKKKKEIDRLNGEFKNFRILFGTEVEIDSEGKLDYNDEILSQFDIVVASIHSGFEQGKDRLTRRLINACRNKYVNVIAHPTGVHLGKREAYDVDLREVCKAAVERNVFLEINSFPSRLDLNSVNAYFARSQGVKFAINSDAHSTEHLSYLKFGVSIARRGWLRKEDVLNTLSLEHLMKTLKKKPHV